MPKPKKRREHRRKRTSEHRKSVRHKRTTKHGGSSNRGRTHRKSSSRKPKRTVGRFIARIYALANYKKADLAKYLSPKGARVGGTGRVKTFTIKKLSPLLSQKGKILKDVGSPGWDDLLLSIIEQEGGLLLGLKSRLEDSKTAESGMEDVERKGAYLDAFSRRLKEGKGLLAKLNKSLEILKKESRGEQKFPKEFLLITLIESKIEKERLFLSLVKKNFLGIKREAGSISEGMVTRDEALIDVALSNLDKQKSVLQMHSGEGKGVDSGELMKLIEPNLYRKERELIKLLSARKSADASVSIKQKVKEKTLIELVKVKVDEERRLISSLKNQLSKVKAEKVRMEITRNIVEEVHKFKKEATSSAEDVGEPKINKDQLFKKYRIKMPSNLLIDSLFKMAEMEDYTIRPTS
jgi:hypothetical protein